MDSSDSQTGKIARSAFMVSFAVGMSRILGLVREQVFAGMFGAGFAYDAFVVAFRIPNLLRDLFAEGALSAAFVAVFTDYDTKKGKEETWRLANNVITVIILFVGIIVIIGAFYSSQIVSLIAPDFSLVAGKHDLTVLMTATMFPFLLLVSLSALAMGILNSKGIFFIPSLASCFFNLGSIVTGVLFAFMVPRVGFHPIVGMSYGVLIGGVLQLLIQAPSLKRTGFRFKPQLNFRDEGLRRIFILMIPAVIGLSATQINLFINTFFASSCAEGSLSWLNYAFRLLMFPIGLIGVSLSIATLPVVARKASEGNIPELKNAYISSTVLSLLFTIPATFGLIFLSKPIVGVIFERGSFTSFDTLQTADVLVLYAVGLCAYAGLKIIVPVFYAIKKTKYPVIGSFLTIILNILVILATIDTYQHRAIALSTSLSIMANFLFLSFLLYRTLNGYNIKYIIVCLLKIIPISLFTCYGAFWLNSTGIDLMGSSTATQIASLLISIIAATVFYFAAVSWTGIQEAKEIRQKLVRKYLKK